jgi:pyruvate dehydrogenase E2 component (dihydrolipoamide acetyltransferase)
MATELTMPKSGHLMEEGTVVSWKKKVGDKIKKGDILLEVEADKGVFEVESPYTGKLSKILVKEQETVPVSTALALIEEA